MTTVATFRVTGSATPLAVAVLGDNDDRLTALHTWQIVTRLMSRDRIIAVFDSWFKEYGYLVNSTNNFIVSRE